MTDDGLTDVQAVLTMEQLRVALRRAYTDDGDIARFGQECARISAAAERERAAKVCEEFSRLKTVRENWGMADVTLRQCAAAIRKGRP